MTPRILILLVPLLLAACGDNPQPFLGNPGATARRLAQPATPLLAVPPPKDALLPDGAGARFASLMAERLLRLDVPSLARPAGKTEWSLTVSARRVGDKVVPRYAVLDPAGKELGTVDGAPVPAAGWTAAAPPALEQAAGDGVDRVMALMTSVQATRDRADPNSLMNRMAKLYVPEVMGAPGDGNSALTRALRAELPQFGPLVQVTPEGADFTVSGTVKVTPGAPGLEAFDISWTVTRPSGVFVGKVSVQKSQVLAGSLNQYWGEVAIVVAQTAASGLFRVVERFAGRDPDKPAGQSPPQPPAREAAHPAPSPPPPADAARQPPAAPPAPAKPAAKAQPAAPIPAGKAGGPAAKPPTGKAAPKPPAPAAPKPAAPAS